MPRAAIAQMIPEKCEKLYVTNYQLERDPNTRNLYVNASIQNDDKYTLIFATFNFDLLIDENVKVGEASQSIGRLLPGEIWKVKIFTSVPEIKNIRLAGISCAFSS